MSQWEREAIGERTATAMQHKARQGEYTGGQAPYGRPLVFLPSGSNFGQFPIAVDRVLSVVAGPNSVFLNVENILGTALSSCGGVLSVTFTSSQLP